MAARQISTEAATKAKPGTAKNRIKQSMRMRSRQYVYEGNLGESREMRQSDWLSTKTFKNIPLHVNRESKNFLM